MPNDMQPSISMQLETKQSHTHTNIQIYIHRYISSSVLHAYSLLRALISPPRASVYSCAGTVLEILALQLYRNEYKISCFIILLSCQVKVLSRLA